MATLKVLLYSTHDTQRYLYHDMDGCLTAEIDSTFRTKCKVKSLRNHGALIEVCSNTRDAIQVLEDKYDSATKYHIRKLKGFISKLQDGDLFYYFNEDTTSIVERKTAIYCLSAMKSGHQWAERLHNDAFMYYSMMNLKFTYISYGYDGIREDIGEIEKDKRVCRFCGKRMPDVTFEKEAHAIQDALGNKLLFCYEECDICNHDLALTEDNFRYLMDFRRAIYNIPRKGSTKTPTIIGKTFIIKADAHGKPELYLMEEELPEPNERLNPFIMHLELKTPINNERMYKALCKIVIDMLPKSELGHFTNTVKWITSKDWIPDALPSAKLTILQQKDISRQPTLDIFINNRGGEPDTPYCTAIVCLYDIAYMFVVPFVDVDCGRYKYDSNLVSHWERISELIGINEWMTQDTMEYRLSTPWVDWLIDLQKSKIHVLPKSNPIFDKCFEVKMPQRSEVKLPVFKQEGVSLAQISSVQFTSYYHEELTDTDLSDVTQHVEGPKFVLLPREDNVIVSIRVDVNDTTDITHLYSFSYKIIYHVESFEDYIKIEYDKNGELVSFAFHYELSKHLLIDSFRNAEVEMSKQRKGTHFEKCSVVEMGDIERFINNIYYYVPHLDEKSYQVICDKEIHGISYCD